MLTKSPLHSQPVIRRMLNSTSSIVLSGVEVPAVIPTVSTFANHSPSPPHRPATAGVSLKGYARISRFLAAVTDADRAEVPQWARIAADTGFCDQSHLVRESPPLGMAPAAVDRERRAEAEMSNRRRAS